MCSGSEAGSYLRLKDSKLESNKEEEEKVRGRTLLAKRRSGPVMS